jgi:hypothetical protein
MFSGRVYCDGRSATPPWIRSSAGAFGVGSLIERFGRGLTRGQVFNLRRRPSIHPAPTRRPLESGRLTQVLAASAWQHGKEDHRPVGDQREQRLGMGRQPRLAQVRPPLEHHRSMRPRRPRERDQRVRGLQRGERRQPQHNHRDMRLVNPPRPTEHAAAVQLTQQQVEAARAWRGKHPLGEEAKPVRMPAGKSPTRKAGSGANVPEGQKPVPPIRAASTAPVGLRSSFGSRPCVGCHASPVRGECSQRQWTRYGRRAVHAAGANNRPGQRGADPTAIARIVAAGVSRLAAADRVGVSTDVPR